MRLLLEMLPKCTKLSESSQDFVDQVILILLSMIVIIENAITVYTSLTLINLQ